MPFKDSHYSIVSHYSLMPLRGNILYDEGFIKNKQENFGIPALSEFLDSLVFLTAFVIS